MLFGRAEILHSLRYHYPCFAASHRTFVLKLITEQKLGFAKKLHAMQILCKLIELNLLLVCTFAIPLFASLGFPTNLHIRLHVCKFNINLHKIYVWANLLQT